MHQGLVLVLALASLLAITFADEDHYTDKYDNINLEEILENERLLKKYLECLLDDTDAHCTADGKELRKHIPDALTNDCEKCTEKQRSGTEKVIKFLRNKKPEDWEKLQAKWDPEGVYRSKYDEEFKKLDS